MLLQIKYSYLLLLSQSFIIILKIFHFPGDVCFESVEANCSAENVNDTFSRWRFSPKQNKCIPVAVNKSCQSKNLFHNEQACSSVCPGTFS